MADSMNCTIVTPAQTIYAGEATYVGLPGEVGGFGVLRGHEPLVSTLKPGLVKITTPASGNGDPMRYLVAGGYAEISDNSVIVLADDAVDLTAIDVSGVRSAIAAAEDALKNLPEGDSERAYYEAQKSWFNLQLSAVNAAE